MIADFVAELLGTIAGVIVGLVTVTVIWWWEVARGLSGPAGNDSEHRSWEPERC